MIKFNSNKTQIAVISINNNNDNNNTDTDKIILSVVNTKVANIQYRHAHKCLT